MFKFEITPDGRNQRWRGKDHSMNYKNSIIDEYNNTIRDLWKTKFKNAINTSNKSKVKFSQPCFHVPRKEESPVWFFGMNPSLPRSPKEIISQDSNLTKNLIVKLKDEQKSMHDNHPYFKAAKNFF